MGFNLDRGSAKILVLGDSGVGKSSLIHLICHSTVLCSVQWTIGCSIDIKLHDNHFLEFWDIGGSRGHKIARSFLYQDYHGIILVFDATNKKSRLNLNEWLLEVIQKTNDKDLESSTSLNVPVITIATKKDLLPNGSDLEGGESPKDYPDKNYSVVEFGGNSRSNQLYRRHQSSDQSNSPLLSSLSATSFTSLANSFSTSEISQGNQVIYVNTQDVLSFNYGSKNHEKLTNFFKLVIDRRNKRVYNKFAI